MRLSALALAAVFGACTPVLFSACRSQPPDTGVQPQKSPSVAPPSSPAREGDATTSDAAAAAGHDGGADAAAPEEKLAGALFEQRAVIDFAIRARVRLVRANVDWVDLLNTPITVSVADGTASGTVGA